MDKKEKDSRKKKSEDEKGLQYMGYKHIGIEIATLLDILEKREAGTKRSQTTKDDETPPKKKKK